MTVGDLFKTLGNKLRRVRKEKAVAPSPGDAVAVSPTPDRNGLTTGVNDAGRLLSYGQNEHGYPTASYHSATTRKTINTPAAALSRLTEGDDVDESTHPDLKIVPLQIGDAKHAGRSLIFHQGAAVGTIDPSKFAGKSMHTVSAASMGADRHFLDRGKAIEAVHEHFVPVDGDPAANDDIEKQTVASFVKVVDSKGIHHDDDGKFCGSGGESKGKEAKKEAASRDKADDAVEEAQKPHAVFTLGGPGSGKGSLAAAYAEKYGITNVIDADTIKRSIPGYSNKEGEDGGFGPSGPRTRRELDAWYSPEQRAALRKTVEGLGFQSIAAFSKHIKGNGSTFGGGLTHELSRFIALKRLDDALAAGTPFVYDSVGGSVNHPKFAQRAINAGMHVHFAQANTPLEVALHRNFTRPRTIPLDLALNAHANSRAAVGVLERFHTAHPMQSDFSRHSMANAADLKAAIAKGYTKKGPGGPVDDDAFAEAVREGHGAIIEPKIAKQVTGGGLTLAEFCGFDSAPKTELV